MRDFVEQISCYAKKENLLIIPQNGQEVGWDQNVAYDVDGFPLTLPDSTYVASIDGIGREDMFYGYENDDIYTPASIQTYFCKFCMPYQKLGKMVFSIDYCSSAENIISSYTANETKNFISFAEPDRQLRIIPEQVVINSDKKYDASYYPYKVNTKDCNSLGDVHNFLFLLNSELYADDSSYVSSQAGEKFICALQKTNYDLLIIDAFASDGSPFTREQINRLKKKANGGKRLVIAYMSIGEAEDYRWYWNDLWVENGVITSVAPAWLDDMNENWSGNYKVRYWDTDWQSLIYGNDDSYTKKIMKAGFDGLYLDIIDAFQYYEEKD